MDPDGGGGWMVAAPTSFARRLDRPGWVAAVALAATAAVVGLLLLVFDSMYMVNDDVAMESFADGSYTGRPESHLVFIGRLPAQILASLYRWLPDAPWYAITLLAAQSLCLAVLAALVWARRRALGWARCTMVVALTVAYVPVLTLTPTFTMTASLLAATAIMIEGFALSSPARTRVQLHCVAAASLTFAATLRWDAVVGVFAILLPFVAAVAWAMGRRRLLLCGAAMAALLGSVYMVDTMWATSGGWSTYAEYNLVRGELHGTSQLSNALRDIDSPEMTSLLQEIRWTKDDLTLFAYWMFDDPVVYSQDNLSRLLDAAGDSDYTSSFDAAMRAVLVDRLALFGLLAVCAAVGVAGVRRRTAALVAGQLVWTAAVFLVVAARLRLPDRVALPNLLALSLVVLLWSSLLTRPETRAAPSSAPVVPRHWLSPISLGITLAVLAVPLMSSRGPVALSNTAGEAHRRLQGQLTALDRVDPDGRFVAFGAAIDSAGVSPLATERASGFLQVLEVGWATFSPHYAQRKRTMGLDGDLFSALVEQEGVYLIGSPSVVPLLQRVYAQRLQIELSADPLATLGNDVSVFRLRHATAEEIAERAP